MVQAAVLTEPHERQERELASSDRYISIAVAPGVNYKPPLFLGFVFVFLFISLKDYGVGT